MNSTADNQDRQLADLKELYLSELAPHVRAYLPEEDNRVQERFVRLSERISEVKLNRHPIRLVVAGEFSTGKSTVINSLIGEELIPAGPEPMTLAPAYFQYGEQTEILLEFNNRTTEPISVEEFRKIKHTNARELPKKYSDIRMIYFKYPYPKLDMIHIIDTPGFNTATEKGDDQRTLDVIEQYADVLLWVFNANNGAAKNSETKILRSLESKVWLEGLSKSIPKAAENDGTASTWQRILQGINKPKTAIGTGELRRSVRIIGLMNFTDQKGLPDSPKVEGLLKEISKETGIENVLAYSARQVLDHRKKNWTEDLGRFISTLDLQNFNGLRVHVTTENSGRGNTCKLFASDEFGINTFEERYIDRSAWIMPKEKLEAQIDEIRKNLAPILDDTLSNESGELYSAIKGLSQKVCEIRRRQIDEVASKIAGMRDLIKTNEKLTKRRIQESLNSFSHSGLRLFLDKIVGTKTERGFFWDDNEFSIARVDSRDILELLGKESKIDKLRKEISNTLLDALEGASRELRLDDVGLAKSFEKYLSESILELSAFNSSAELASVSGFNVATNAGLFFSGLYQGRPLKDDSPAQKQREKIAEEIFTGAHYCTVYHWIEVASETLHSKLTSLALNYILELEKYSISVQNGTEKFALAAGSTRRSKAHA
jgi:GTPase SAR1 family protein